MGGVVVVIIIIVVMIILAIALCVAGGILVTILTTLGILVGSMTGGSTTAPTIPSITQPSFSYDIGELMTDEDLENWFLDRPEGTTEEGSEESSEENSTKPENSGVTDQSQFKNYGEDCKTTILVYMNGSDLETEDGMATADLEEMAAAKASDQVNIVIETLGTTSWQTAGISGDTAERYQLKNGQLVQLQTGLGKVSAYDPETLTDFITYGTSNFPADRYFLILWDHGGGPVYGYGYDLWSEDESALTASELKKALTDANVHFDMVGFDACIMGCLEISSAVEDYADYLVASEDFESGYGWEYANWMNKLAEEPGIATPSLGAIICDDYSVESKEADSNGILALVDLSQNKELRNAWVTFAYAHKNELLEYNYSSNMTSEENGRVLNHTAYERDRFGDFFNDLLNSVYSIDSYGAVDLMAAAKTIGGDGSQELIAAFAKTVIYCAATEDETNLAGLSVTLPYGDNEMYAAMNFIYPEIGFDSDYVAFMSDFTSVETNSWYDYGDYSWDGWDFDNGEYSFGGWDEEDGWDFSEDWFRELLGDDYYDEYFKDYYDEFFSDYDNYFSDWGSDDDWIGDDDDEYDYEDLLNDLDWLFQ